MIFNNLMNVLFGTNARPDLEQKQDAVVPVVKVSANPSVSKVPKGKYDYDADVDAIQNKYGELKTGISIEAELQDLLKICPRRRPRTDAYQGLCSYLMAEYGVCLNIKSRKRK